MGAVADPTGLPVLVGAAVLGSAVLHASWNAVAKAIPDRLLASGLIGVSFAAVGVVWCLLAPLPDAAAWPYLVGSAVLQTGYLLLLTAAYSHGEFRRIYPVARGTAPVLVTVFSLAVLGERLAAGQLAGIAVVVVSLAWLATVRPRAGLPGDTATPGDGRRDRRGLWLALATGVLIAAYSLTDGIGVRQSGSAAGYAAWSLVVHGPLLIATCLVLAGPRRLLAWFHDGPATVGDPGTTGIPGPGLAHRTRPGVLVTAGLIGGLLSLAAYAIVLWAQSRASLSLVSALRETSVLFAGIIGALLFAEGFSIRQTVAVVGVVGGIALIQLT